MQTFDFKVQGTPVNADPAGIFVSSRGSDAASGTVTAPFLTLAQAVKVAQPGDTIFVRGGEYRNAEFGQPYGTSRSGGSLVRISTSGTPDAPITLRNFGNEYVKLKSDVTGIALNGVTDWVIDGLEIEGNARDLDEAAIMDQWWDPDSKQTGSRGITGSFNRVTIRNSAIHDFPGAGISNDDGEYLTIEDNLVFNNASWSTGGVQGIALTGLSNTGASNEFAIKVRGNLVFGNQSLIISHVFSKGFVTLTIDEGHGILLQDTTTTFKKAALVENNLGLFNGKACVGLNRFDKATIRNNACYMNSRVVVEGGEIVSNNSSLKDIHDNLFHPRSDRVTFRLLPSSDSSGIGANATRSGIAGDTALPSQTSVFGSVFANPAAFDFKPAAGVPAGMGVASTVLDRLAAKLREYGFVVGEPPQVVTDATIQAQRVKIFATWPAAWSSIKLIDKATGNEWVYAQRCHYPNWPAAADC